MSDRQTVIGFIVCIIGLILIYGYSFTWEGSNRDLLLREGGLIESASSLGYFLCAALILYRGRWAYLKRYGYFLLLVFLFGFRELDFDKQFTTKGILQMNLYTSQGVPIIEKLIGLVGITILV